MDKAKHDPYLLFIQTVNIVLYLILLIKPFRQARPGFVKGGETSRALQAIPPNAGRAQVWLVNRPCVR